MTELTAYVSNLYIETTYDSCKSVMMSATNQPAMNLLCGPWGAYKCSAHRWFDYMGSTSNGFSPFDILYKYTYSNFSDPNFEPFQPNQTFMCNQRINVSENHSKLKQQITKNFRKFYCTYF